MEDLVERCRAATGKAAADLVDEATAAPGVLVFGELLDLEGVQALASDPSLASTLAQLRVFAHGTLPDYRADSSLPPLSPAQELKLRRLTVASLAERSAVLSYADLMRALELSTIRELEDLLINECVAAGVVRGRLDQKERRFEVHEAMARDVEPGRLGELIASLEAWREDVRAALAAAAEQAGARARARGGVETRRGDGCGGRGDDPETQGGSRGRRRARRRRRAGGRFRGRDGRGRRAERDRAEAETVTEFM